MADMQLIDVTIKRHKWGWTGHTLGKDESSVAQQAMQWNRLDGFGAEMGVLRDVETNCGKAVLESKQNLV